MESPQEVDYKASLTDLFGSSNISEQQIDETISIVLEEDGTLSPAEKLEGMVNILIDCGDSTSTLESSLETEEGAVGFRQNMSGTRFNQCFDTLLNMFPDICPNYLIQFCEKYDYFDLDTVVDELIQTDYVKLDKDPLDILEHLKQMLPHADPAYLRNQARVLVDRPTGDLEEFVQNALEKQDFPTMRDYLQRKEWKDEKELYITNFNVEEFLRMFPNAVEVFLDPNRKSSLSIQSKVTENDVEFGLNCLYNNFTFLRKREIEKVFHSFDRNLIKASNRLRNMPKDFRQPRIVTTDDRECRNVTVLQEVAFILHEKLIRQRVKQKSEKYRAALEEARTHGLLQTCACCYDDELIPEECFFCSNGCIFCKSCVKFGAETVIGKGDTVFPCLADCGSEFGFHILQMVLDKKVFQRLCQRKQIEEIKSANIDNLESCPHCDFCTIPAEGDKIFKCENVECMKETCRECRHPAHVPLRCNEIEYDEDVRMRTYIENQMTEALLRQCWKCSKKFYKESGCNKMTCTCGGIMCYVCGQAVTDYAHFNRGTCPLYTENLKEFHMNRVLQGAQRAKNELGINADPNKLKFDPARNLDRDVN